MKAWRIIKRYLPYVIMYGIAFLWIIPILWMADTAFKPRPEILTIPPSWIPSHFTVENIQRLFAQWPFGRWVLNSVIVSSFVTLGSLIVSTLAAFSFARLHWRGRDTLFMILLVFMPIGVFLLRQFFINIPKELEDAARIDGCSSFGVLTRVIIPVSKPVFAAFGVYMFNFAWNEFFWSMIVLRKSQMVTLPVGLKLLQGAFEIDYGLILAGAFMASLPSLFVFLLLRRQIIRGFTLAGSGSKG